MWYQFIYVTCPVCGREFWYKERVVDRPKPSSVWDRHIRKEIYDGCQGY